MVPEVRLYLFERLGKHFHQDVFVLYGNVKEATASFARQLTADEQTELAAFLANALDRKNDAELARFWQKSGSDIMVGKSEYGALLSQILAELEVSRRRIR
jgi:hypothetical protein